MHGSFAALTSLSGSIELRTSLENPRVSLQDPEAWEAMYGSEGRSDSGVKVSPKSSMSLAAVWQAVSMISGDIARLPLDIYRRTDNGRTVDKQHPAWWLVREQPNDEQHAFRFWRTIVAHALLWGNGYAYIDRHPSTGAPRGLYPLLPDRTAPERDRQTRRLVYATETSKPDGSPWLKAILPSDVLHIAGLSIDGTAGAELVKHARHAIGLGLARQKFESKFFRHGVRAGGILELPLGSGEKFQQNVTEGFRKHHEGEDAWFKTVVLRDGVKFHQTSFNAQEAQLDEASERGVREVSRYFNLAPSRLGVAGSTSYNSKQEDNQAYLDSTLSPWLADITSECRSKLLSDAERRDSHYFEHNTAVLLSMDLLKRYQAYAIGVRNRWLTPNMVLAKENEESVPWGDDPVPIAGAAGGVDKGENDRPRGPAQDADSAADSERQALVRRLIYRLTDHARTKASKGHRSFCEWLSGDLKQHRQAAVRSLGEDTLIDDCLHRFRLVLDAPVSELTERVDQIAAAIETEH